jgi:hypothetical protein
MAVSVEKVKVVLRIEGADGSVENLPSALKTKSPLANGVTIKQASPHC